MRNPVPNSLRTWFILHGIIDLLFALPLMIIPAQFLALFGFTAITPILARLVGAALIGIGGASLLEYNKGKEGYNSMLTLKILWSISALVGLIVSIAEGEASSLWIIVFIFAIFCGVWTYYKWTYFTR